MKPVGYELKAQRIAVIGDRRDIVEHFLESLIQKPPVGILLNFYQIRHFQNFLLSRIAHTRDFGVTGRTDSVLFH